MTITAPRDTIYTIDRPGVVRYVKITNKVTWPRTCSIIHVDHRGAHSLVATNLRVTPGLALVIQVRGGISMGDFILDAGDALYVLEDGMSFPTLLLEYTIYCPATMLDDHSTVH